MGVYPVQKMGRVLQWLTQFTEGPGHTIVLVLSLCTLMVKAGRREEVRSYSSITTMISCAGSPQVPGIRLVLQYMSLECHLTYVVVGHFSAKHHDQIRFCCHSMSVVDVKHMNYIQLLSTKIHNSIVIVIVQLYYSHARCFFSRYLQEKKGIF